MTRSRFIIVKHEAKRARLHYDLRFKMPNSNNWASFAVRKGVPTTTGTKVLAVRTHDHTPSEALFLGTIEQGYGAGKLDKWDDGSCDIIKYTPAHISIDFKGSKVKGIYHFINVAITKGKKGVKEYKNQSYILFKGKPNLKESIYPDRGRYSDRIGLKSAIHASDVETDEEAADKQQKKPLSWSKPKSTYIKKPTLKGFLNDCLNRIWKG